MKFTFIGCSLTVGAGLAFEKTDPNNYTNIVANHYSADIFNLANGGNSNYNIFISAINELLFNPPTKLFVQWSALNRTWIYPSPNLNNSIAIMPSSTADAIMPSSTADYHLNNISGLHTDIFKNKKELQTFIDQYLSLNIDYGNIYKLIGYCNILQKLADEKNCQLILINGLIPWTEEIQLDPTTYDLSSTLSDYTKELIQFDNNQDEDILAFLKILSNELYHTQLESWVNIFDSMYHSMIDFGDDNQHPGPKSHRRYAEMIINYLEDTND